MRHEDRKPKVAAAIVHLLTVREHLDEAIANMYSEMKGQMRAQALSGQPGRGAGATLMVGDEAVPATGVELAGIDAADNGDEAARALERLDRALEQAVPHLKKAAAIVRDWQHHDLSDDATSFLRQQAKGGDPLCEPCSAQGHVALSFTKEPSDVKGNLRIPKLLCREHWNYVRDNGAEPSRKWTADLITRRVTANVVPAGAHA